VLGSASKAACLGDRTKVAQLMNLHKEKLLLRMLPVVLLQR
jgi:hypothetical protein